MNFSPHFTFQEMTRTDKKHLQEQNRIEAKHPAVLRNLGSLCTLILEPVRDLVKLPVLIHSGFRFELLNLAVDGSKNSQHLRGEAADFSIHGRDLEEIFDLIRNSNIQYGQLILEPTWIHISLPALYQIYRQALRTPAGLNPLGI